MVTPLIDRPTLKGEWNRLVETAHIPAHGSTQYREMRRAFYAGAAMWASMMLEHLDGGDEPTPEDMEFITSLHEELDEFCRLLKSGMA